MLIFQKIRWKNFLSTGATFTEIDLNKNTNTLIIGENGAGKSTVLDALAFALFGKPYRNINKPQLVNSINQKECLVEVDFFIGSVAYKIRRGIKPAIFEILVDGKLLNQDSKSKDYQEYLETNIIKMNQKSFTQIVILGAASFTPFMQLSAADRREVIEDLLDIQIFSNMNTLVKEKQSAIRESLSTLKIKLEAAHEKVSLHKRHLDEMKKNNNEMVQQKQEEYDSNESTIQSNLDKVKELEDEVTTLFTKITDLESIRNKQKKLIGFESKIKDSIQKIETEFKFYHDNDNCPNCKQILEPKFKGEKIVDCELKFVEYNKGLSKLIDEQDTVATRLSEIDAVTKQISTHQSTIMMTNNSTTHLQRNNMNLMREISKLKENKSVSVESMEQSEKLVKEIEDILDKRKDEYEQKRYYDLIAQLLKDGGIKTRIIKQYLPIINKTVNKYLSAMDFFVNFEMDEEFKETIKSRYRDAFSYENFSEGEKQKIDLALLLTWRTIAKLKNSVNTNLLVLDETFDSSLDTKGTDSLLQILNTLSDKTNIFVISHKDQLHDKFSSSIRFEKKKNFSRAIKG